MQTAYRCTSCKYVHVGKVSSCDCDNKPFRYTLVHIIDVPESETKVPDFKSLLHSREPRLCNYENGNAYNAIYFHAGERSSGRPDVKQLGTMSSSYEHRDMGYNMYEKNMKANCVLAAAGPDLLEVAYMCYQYFQTKRLIQGPSPKTDQRINIIAEAIRFATDISVFDVKQKVTGDD